MSYPEDKDPLTGKGRRHTAASLAVLGLSKAVIEEVDDKLPPKGEIQDEDKEFWKGTGRLEQGDMLTWNRGNHIAIVSDSKKYEMGNTEYLVAMLSPPALRGLHIDIDLSKITNIGKIKNTNKDYKEFEDVIIYWRDVEKNKIEVGQGKITKKDKIVGINTDFYFIRYTVVLSEGVDDYPAGYDVHVYEYIGKERNPTSKSGYAEMKYRTDRIWRKLLP